MRMGRLLVVAMMVAACGVPVDATPRTYADEVRVEPIDLGELAEPAGEATVDMYFVSEGALVAVPRGVPGTEPREVARALVDARLADDPAVRSAIPPGTRVRDVRVDEGIATVDLTEGFALVGGDEEILAVGQIVMTVGSLDGVDGVRFSLAGVPVSAPVGEGELTDRPLVPGDFRELLATPTG